MTGLMIALFLMPLQGPELTPIWATRLQTEIQSYVIGETAIYFGTNDSYGALDQATGKKIWAKSVAQPQLGVFVAEGDGTLYANIGQGNLVAANAATGKPLWTLKRTGYASPIGFANQSLYAEVEEGKLSAVNASGKAIWSATLGGSLSTRPIRYNRVIFAGLKTGAIHAVDKDSGKPMWKYAERKSGVQALLVSGERLIVTYDDGTIHGLSLTTGQRMWGVYTNNALFGVPHLREGRLFAVSASGRFYCVAAETGQELWVRSLSFQQNFGLSQVMPYRDGFLLADKAKLVALDSEGLKLWDLDTGSEMTGNQPRPLGDDLLLTGSHEFRRVRLKD